MIEPAVLAGGFLVQEPECLHDSLPRPIPRQITALGRDAQRRQPKSGGCRTADVRMRRVLQRAVGESTIPHNTGFAGLLPEVPERAVLEIIEEPGLRNIEIKIKALRPHDSGGG